MDELIKKNYNNSCMLVNELTDKSPIYYLTKNLECYGNYAKKIKEELSSLDLIFLYN